MENKNLPAFPAECVYRENGELKGVQTGNESGFEIGLTKREYFAIRAMNGLLANSSYTNERLEYGYASDAVAFADALLKELENTRP